MREAVNFLQIGIWNFFEFKFNNFKDLRVECVLFDKVENGLFGDRLVWVNNFGGNSFNKRRVVIVKLVESILRWLYS